MKCFLLQSLLGAVFLAQVVPCLATIHYVDLNCANPTAPYTSWANAATNIQDAMDIAVIGDQVLVTNGVYSSGGRVRSGSLTNRVIVNYGITVRSVNGPKFTTIEGYQVPGITNAPAAVRCVDLVSGVLEGFTLKNGATIGFGGIDSDTSGGGVLCGSEAIVTNCVLIGNSAFLQGGGAYISYGAVVTKCRFIGNSAAQGGGVAGGFESKIDNCVLFGNSASQIGGGSRGVDLNSCTVVLNRAESFGGGTSEGLVENCIVMFNSGAAFFSEFENYYHCTLHFSCARPMPDDGLGNIARDPLFVDALQGNFSLKSNSPVINAGGGVSFEVSLGTDLDGNPRVNGGRVDIGALEFQMDPFHEWLAAFRLPFDGSADDADSDSDGMSNRFEWNAGTDPTNALSVLQVLSATNFTLGIRVRWRGVNDRNYFLERATSLNEPVTFSLVASNVPGRLPITSYTDTNVVGKGAVFYRVGVVP